MTDINKVTNIPVSFTISDTEYKLSKLTLQDLGEYEQWVKDEKAKSMLKYATKDERVEIIERVETDTGPDAVFEAMKTFKGATHALWLSLRTNHPALTEEEVGRMLDPDTLVEVQKLMSAMADPSVTAEKESSPSAERGSDKEDNTSKNAPRAAMDKQ